MNKRRRLATPRADQTYNRTRDLATLLESNDSPTTCPAAFSPTSNLIALAPRRSSTSSAESLFKSSLEIPEHPQPLTISLTYLSGSTTASSPRFSFNLQLPLTSFFASDQNPNFSPSSNQIKLLSFSPDGAYLLCVSGSGDAENNGMDDYLTVFEQADTGCIDQWSMILHEQAGRFGARGSGGGNLVSGVDGKEVVSVRWVGEPRAWFPTPGYVPSDMNDGTQSSTSQPFSCAPPRSSPISGAAFVAVLSSDEIVFVHLPRTSPLLPNIVCMPLHPPPSALASPRSGTSDLPEVTAASPSRRALSLTAVPTPPTSLATSINSSIPSIGSLPVGNQIVSAPVDQPTPTSSISQLVGSLVSTLPSLDSSLPMPIAPSPAAGAGNAALKEELRAAELANTIEGENQNGGHGRRRVRMADLGAVRGSRVTSEAGLTTFMVATLTRRSRSRPRPSPAAAPNPSVPLVPPPIASQSLSNATIAPDLDMNMEEENFDLAALDGFDFASLDAAFGSSEPTKPVVPRTEPPDHKQSSGDDDLKDWDAWEKEHSESHEENGKDQWKVELSEVRIDMLNVDGPRLTVKPQPHFFASPPTFASEASVSVSTEHVQDGRITHLAFLEDTELATTETSSHVGSESAVDLRLLVVCTSSSNTPQSSLSSYCLSQEQYQLSEAFASLECKKADVSNVDLGEWCTVFASEAVLPDSAVLTALAARPTTRTLSSFVAVLANRDGASEMSEETNRDSWSSKVAVLSSDTLLPLSSERQTILPSRNFYNSVLLSPNSAIVVALPQTLSNSPLRPVIAASPLIESTEEDCASRLALSSIRQGDAADVIGVATSDKRDSQAISDLLEDTHSLVQAQLPSSRPLQNTSIQFDILGIAAALFNSSNTSDASSRSKMKTAEGLVECAAAVRAFTKVEKRQRGAEKIPGYRCETDALWPLVGHANWYAHFVEQLIQDTLRSSTVDPPSALLLHFLHPLSRSLHTRLYTSLLGLSSTLSALALAPEPGMGVAEQEMVDLAGKVVEDAVRGAAGGLEKWKSVLEKVEDIEGLVGGFSFSSSLSTLIVPQTVYPQATSVLAVLREAYPSLTPNASDSLPSPPKSPLPSAAVEWDAIRKCQLPRSNNPQNKSQLMMKQCLRCGKKSGAVSATGGSGVWASFEEGWRSRCACGGLWRSI